jgi:hypothetical protein
LVLAPHVAQSSDTSPSTPTPHDQACGSAYVQAQLLRRESRLRAARESLLRCSSESCPAGLRSDCTRWLAEVEIALPTVVFSLKGRNGEDLSAVRVDMDGTALVESLGGTAVPVDPGRHTFRFEPTGYAPVEVEAVISEGERDRIVRAEAAPRASSVRSPSSLVPPLAVGATALVLVGVGASFEIVGLSSKNSADLCTRMPSSCSDPMYDSFKSSAQHEFLAGDILIGVGLVAVGAAVYLYLSGRPREAPQSRLSLPIPLGARGIQFRF